MRLSKDVETLYPDLCRWKDHLHTMPELGLDLPRTAAYVRGCLEDMGVANIRDGLARYGLVATLSGRDPGPVLALRADMDGLPIQEDAQHQVRSDTQGRMHACGHDAHMAVLLGVARHFTRHPGQLKGSLKLVFQPGEEGPGGAQPMIEQGALKDPDADAILGLHVWSGLETGRVGVRPGVIMAAADSFSVTVKGRGGHGAMPHETVDSIVVACDIIQALQLIVSRKMDPLKPVALSVGTIKGGCASNVIAPQVRFTGTFRTLEEKLRDEISGHIARTVSGVCQLHGADYQYHRTPGYPPVVNHRAMTDLVRSQVKSIRGLILEDDFDPTLGAEDMAYYLRQVPGCFFFVGAGRDDGKTMPHHHPGFEIDPRAMAVALAVLLRSISAFFTTPPDCLRENP